MKSFSTYFRRIAPYIACLGLALVSLRVSADTTVSFFQSFAGNTNFIATGGHFRNSATNQCTVNATSTEILAGIPGGSTIRAAYLYWAASDVTGGSGDPTVTLQVGAAINIVNSSRNFNSDVGARRWSGHFADVTGLISGNATITVSNLTINTGAPHCGIATVFGGWALVVVYENTGTEPFRVVNVYDGFQQFRGSSITLTPGNFQIPAAPGTGSNAIVTWEGDVANSAPLGGFTENLTFNGVALTDLPNPLNNQFNSTVNIIDNLTNHYGTDVDTYTLTSPTHFNPGDTSATTVYSSGGDRVLLMTQVISLPNVPVTDLAVSKNHSGNFDLNQNEQFVITVTNNGPSDTSAGAVRVTDTLDSDFTFVSGTGSGWSCSAIGQDVTCDYAPVLTNTATTPPLTLTVTVGEFAEAAETNTATVTNTDAGQFDNITANNSSTDNITVNVPVLTTSTKTFVDQNGSGASPNDTLRYTITVTESAGIAATNVRVTDDIPANVANFSVVSTPAGSTDSSTGAGTGANNTGFLDINSFTVPANSSVTIVFDVDIASGTAGGTTIDNTANISRGGTTLASPAAPTITVQVPDLSTSAKSAVEFGGGGDFDPGDTIRYTITITETAGFDANNVQVTDVIPVGTTFSAVINNGGGTVNTTTPTLDITGITVPANSSVTVVFDVTINPQGPGSVISNSADIIYDTITTTVGPVNTIVSASLATPASGNKPLYLYDNANLCPAPHNQLLNLSRLPPQCAQNFVQITEGGNQSWTQQITLQAPLTIQDATAPFQVPVQLLLNEIGPGSLRTVEVRLALVSNPTVFITSGNINVNLPNAASAPNLVTFNLALASGAPVNIAAGEQFLLTVFNRSTGSGNRRVRVHPVSGGQNSAVILPANTVINVDSVNGFDAAFAGGVVPAAFTPGDTVYIRAVVSDPFGSFDIVTTGIGNTTPNVQVTITDALSNPTTVTNADMTLVADSGTNTKTFEFQYTIPAPPVNTGFWTASVTATEGTEGTVTHSLDGSFRVEMPNISASKLTQVISDPTGGPNPHALPGAVIRYTVTVDNLGLGRASNVVISDDLNSEITAGRLQFNADTYAVGEGMRITAPDINGGVAISRTNAADADECDFNATTTNTVTCNIGQLEASEQSVMVFEVTIQ